MSYLEIGLILVCLLFFMFSKALRRLMLFGVILLIILVCFNPVKTHKTLNSKYDEYKNKVVHYMESTNNDNKDKETTEKDKK